MRHQLSNSLVPLILFFTLEMGKPHAQELTNPQAEIEKIFAEIETKDGPGGSGVIWHRGQNVYQTYKGLASGDPKTSIGSESLFNLGNLSDHFVAFAVLQLAHEGELSLSQSVEAYLPLKNSLFSSITVKHLLSHSSGLHDVSRVLAISGKSDTNQSEILQLIQKQGKLGFEPGTEFAINRTNLFLLEIIVESVTGEAYTAYLENHIFPQASLKNTTYKPDVINSQVAKSFNVEENAFYAIPGQGDRLTPRLYSTVEDLLQWELFLKIIKIRKPSLYEQLHEVAQLNDGKLFNWPEGKLTLGQQFKNSERGMAELYQVGSYQGFASSIFKFPEEDFLSIILTNNGMEYSGYFGIRTAYLLMDESFPKPASIDFNGLQTLTLSNKSLQTYEGQYWDMQGELVRKIETVNDTLRYTRSADNSSPLIPIEKDLFLMMFPGDEEVKVKFNTESKPKEMYFVIEEADPIRFEIFEPVKGLSKEKELNGNYKNELMNASFRVAVDDESLLLIRNGQDTLTYSAVTNRLFANGPWYMPSITFTKNNKGQVTGFVANNAGIKNLTFEKEE